MNMKLLITTFVCLLAYCVAPAQIKPLVDTNAYRHWASLVHLDESGGRISPDGKLVLFVEDDGYSNMRLVISTSEGHQLTSIPGVKGEPAFTRDSKHVCFIQGTDSLHIWNRKNNTATFIDHAKTYAAAGLFLLYHQQDTFVTFNLQSGKQNRYPHIRAYELSKSKNSVLLQGSTNLKWIDFPENRAVTIFNRDSASQFVFDPTGTRLAFIYHKVLMYYQKGMQEAIPYVTSGIPPGFRMSAEKPVFNKTGQKLFFQLERNVVIPQEDPSLAKVNVWNYRDTILYSQQQFRLTESPERNLVPERKKLFLAVKNELTNHIVILENEYDNIGLFTLPFTDASYLLSRYGESDWLSEDYWNNGIIPQHVLIATSDGSRILLPTEKQARTNLVISPEERYVIWFDRQSAQYKCFDISSKNCHMLSAGIPHSLYYDLAEESSQQWEYGIAAWDEQGRYVYLYDQFDIWKADLRGTEKPVCVTSGYGRSHQQILSFIHDGFESLKLNRKRKYPLAAYSQETKLNGFVHLVPDRPNAIEPGVMEPYTYCIPRVTPSGFVAYTNFIGQPAKALDADVYVLRRQSAEEAPNVFVTKNFKEFQAISNIHPEKKYNWLTTELVKWTLPDGKSAQGILYKPENLDPGKKYPLIFEYYMKRSDELHMFIRPEYSRGLIDIPTYVSNGYLVFVPDIYYTKGHPALSATNTVVSAANDLSQRPYVDKKRMGLQGHSFGGYQTMAIIAHSNIFAAACSAAGVSNLSSCYGDLRVNGETSQFIMEVSQGNMGSAPWEQPALYVENSPVFHIDKITTPLLLMANRDDGNVAFNQSVQMFTGMRRAGKKAWMLEYDKEGHGLGDEKNCVDFTIRMQQFFDYYLKGTPPPVWMTKGVPAKDKGKLSGLAADLSGNQP